MSTNPAARTRFSLYYLAGYLLPTGLLLFFAPGLALKLLFSRGDYGDVFPRFAGLLLFGLGIVVVQIIRHRLDALYPTTLFVRAIFVVGIVRLYVMTGDPLFLCILGVVSLGLVLTGVASVIDRRGSGNSAVP